ncbi:DUF4476 domain-containing protein [Psychroserpens burtonensis]|uniref:DUF4476 domain-containing protein n=1 Tax=Psychroserpens burtonensis TaxID=49278 RepID=A0A5C7B612_9FLAO|nr:DUF4476 domain-containing protein [Psychroserpens burtonensis]TXE15904.1 DUF4476 domain-containing protein [Psychroserpens burtonensis]
MKKITILALLLVSLFSNAQESRLTIFSEDGDAFYLILNGVRQNKEPLVNIAVDYLINEYYDTKIIFADDSTPILNKRHLMVVNVDNRRGEFIYKIKTTEHGKKLRFYSFTPFQAILPPPSNVSVIHYNAMPLPPIQTITQTTTTMSSGNGDQINIGVGVNAGGTNVGIGINVNAGSSTTTTQSTTTTIGGPADVVIFEDTGCYAMSRWDFGQALASIKSKTFSDSRLTLAKQVTKGSCLTSGQITQITSLFDFEDSKLEYAKFAYSYCYNPENYWKVNNAFEFESTIDELNEHIESFGH